MCIAAQKLARIIARDGIDRLGQIVGAKRKEVAILGDGFGLDTGARRFDHGTDFDVRRVARSPNIPDNRFNLATQMPYLADHRDKRDHDFRPCWLTERYADLLGSLKNRPYLHLIDFGEGDA